MQITYNLPSIIGFGTSAKSKDYALRALQTCLATINQQPNRATMHVQNYQDGKLVTLDLPYVFHPHASRSENARVLRALLLCLININLGFLQSHHVPGLYRSGVFYKRTIWWEPIPALYHRGFGDCKSLSAALIAEYRKSGREAEPVFRYKPRANGALDFHILVMTPHGWEDPSKRLGMGQDENKWFRQG